MVQLNLDSKRLAKTYDEVSDSQFANGRDLVEQLGVGAGDTVLDIGCGTGRLGLHVLEKIGSGGRFIGVDPLPERISIATARNTHPNAQFRVGVAEDLEFVASGSVDVVYLSAVFHWIRDKEKALTEIFRVLKPGGRVGLTTGAKELAHTTTLRRITDGVLKREPFNNRVNVEDYATNRSGVTTTELVTLLVSAGFDLDDIRIRSVLRHYRSGQHIIDFVESSTFGNYLNHVPAELQDKARREIESEFEKLKTEDGINFKGYTIFALAAKPVVH